MTDRTDELKDSLERLLAKSHHKGAVSFALKTLFPKVSSFLEPSFSSSRVQTPAIQRRISHRSFSRGYFQLSPNEKLWPKSEFERAISTGEPDQAFDVLGKHLTNTDDDRLVRDLCIDIFTEVMKSPNTDGAKWFRAINDHADLLIGDDDPRNVPFFGLSLQGRVRVLLLRSLERVPQENRAGLLANEADSTSDVTLVCTVFRSIAGDAVSDGAAPSYEHIRMTDDESNRLREHLVERVREKGRNGSLWEQKGSPELLWFWRNSGYVEEVREFASQQMKTQAGLNALLAATISYVHSSEGNFERVSIASWSKLLDLEKLEGQARALASSGSKSDQDLSVRFLNAFARGAEFDL